MIWILAKIPSFYDFKKPRIQQVFFVFFVYVRLWCKLIGTVNQQSGPVPKYQHLSTRGIKDKTTTQWIQNKRNLHSGKILSNNVDFFKEDAVYFWKVWLVTEFGRGLAQWQSTNLRSQRHKFESRTLVRNFMYSNIYFKILECGEQSLQSFLKRKKY